MIEQQKGNHEEVKTVAEPLDTMRHREIAIAELFLNIRKLAANYGQFIHIGTLEAGVDRKTPDPHFPRQGYVHQGLSARLVSLPGDVNADGYDISMNVFFKRAPQWSAHSVDEVQALKVSMRTLIENSPLKDAVNKALNQSSNIDQALPILAEHFNGELVRELKAALAPYGLVCLTHH